MLVQIFAVVTTACAVYFMNWYALICYPIVVFAANVALLKATGYWQNDFEVFRNAKVRKYLLSDSSPPSLSAISIVDAKLAVQSFFTPIFERNITILMGQLMRQIPEQRSELIFVRQEGAHCLAHELFNTTLSKLSNVFDSVQKFSQRLFKLTAYSRNFNAIILAINEVGFHTFDVKSVIRAADRVSLPELRRLFLYHLIEELEHSYECVYVMREIHPLTRLAWTPACIILLVFVYLAFEVFAIALLIQHNSKEALRYVLTLEFVLHFLDYLNNIARAIIIVHFVKFPSEAQLEKRHIEYIAIARDRFSLDLTKDTVEGGARG
jgi:hypothetical protein